MPDRAGHDRRSGYPCAFLRRPYAFLCHPCAREDPGSLSFMNGVERQDTGFVLDIVNRGSSFFVENDRRRTDERQQQRCWMPDRAGHDRRSGHPCAREDPGSLSFMNGVERQNTGFVLDIVNRGSSFFVENDRRRTDERQQQRCWMPDRAGHDRKRQCILSTPALPVLSVAEGSVAKGMTEHIQE